MVDAALVADIGGTNVRFAMVNEVGQLTAQARYPNARFGSFDDALATYLQTVGMQPQRAALAVAGPVDNARVEMTNLGWHLVAADLAERHAIPRVEIMNDFAAQAWATLDLTDAELQPVGGGTVVPQANRAILGPGTGLGVSGLVRAADDWAVVAGEGGHVTLAGSTPLEHELIDYVASAQGHCSAEKLLSGPGLATIHTFLKDAPLAPAAAPTEVTRLAAAGDVLAKQAVELFCTLLGTVAGDLALTFGARGGVYLTGGILPDILPLFVASGFRRRFATKGRFSDWLAKIPVRVVTAPEPSLRGLRVWVSR